MGEQITLIILEFDTSLSLPGNGEFILGRYNPEMATQGGSNVVDPGRVDIDLTPYQAYEAGVSRRHAAIYIGYQLFTVTDLGSTNGTRVNGNTIPSFTPQELRDQDIITLGKLKIQVRTH